MTREAVSRPLAHAGPCPLLIPLIALALACSSESGQPTFREVNWRLVREVGRGRFSHPSAALGFNGLAAGGGRVYVYDSQGTFPFYVVDTESFEVRGFGAWGRGSGEVGGGFPVALSVTDDRLFAYAPFESKLLVFSEDLALVEEYGPTHGVPSLGALSAVNDTLAFFFGLDPLVERTSLAHGYRIHAQEGISRTALSLGDYARLPELEPLRRNPVLNQGPVHADGDGRVFWAHYYSSLRIGFSSDGTPLFLRFDPRGVRIPKADVRKTRDVVAGDPERAVQSYLALTSDDRNLYALYSGEELTREAVMAWRAGRGNTDLRLGEGQIVDVFDKADGSYWFSLRLPVLATNLAVDGRWLYVITSQEGPRLLVYEKPPISFSYRAP